MKLRITLGALPWESWLRTYQDPPHLGDLRRGLNGMFAAYAPKRLSEDVSHYDYRTQEISVPADDPKVEALLARFDGDLKQAGGAAAMVREIPTAEELKRARFLQLVVYGDFVDHDVDWRSLNPTEHTLCKACSFPDISRPPQPLLVGKAALKKQDVFRVSTGMLVVRPPVLDLLKSAIGEQIEVGEAVIAGAKRKASGDSRLFWVRPPEMIGDELLKKFPQACPVCKRPVESRRQDEHGLVKSGGPGVYDMRDWLEHFGSGRADLAVLGGYYGEFRREEGRWSCHWNMAISGSLFAYLKSNHITGIALAAADSHPKCFMSRKGEPTLAAPRAFGAKDEEAARRDEASVEAGRQLVASLENVPWDCQRDRHVYFHLTTPELIVLDPMTWEADSGGPYRVKGFTGPGLYRLPVSAIKNAERGILRLLRLAPTRGTAVDSGTLLFVDNAFFGALQDAYEWEKAINAGGAFDTKYHAKIAETIGNRFGICSSPPAGFRSDFAGDGLYCIDEKQIERVK